MFTQQCFIRKRNRNIIQSLIDLGYGYPAQSKGNAISTSNNEVIVELVLLPENKLNCIIDCGDNEEMFLALAALRDDSDKYQWFVNKEGNHWVKCNAGQKAYDDTMYFSFNEYHKATPEEIVEYFKNK